MKNNEKMITDDQIRGALEHFEQPYNEQHWHAMSAQLTALEVADATFDAALKERLANISVLPTADAWSKMSEQLDDLEAADASFDETLRERLIDVAAVPKVGDWSKMVAALDSFDDTEIEFDDVLRRKLENIAGNHPNHWAMMNERLDREFTLRGKIVRYKIIEAALMLLALFTVINAVDWNRSAQATDKEDVFNRGTPNASEWIIEKEDIKAIAPTLKIKTPQSGTNGAKSFDNSTNWRLRGGIQRVQNEKQSKQNNRQNASSNPQTNWTPTGQPIVDNALKNDVLPNFLNNLAKNAANTEGGNLQNGTLQNGAVVTLPSGISSKNETVNNNVHPVGLPATTLNQTVVDIVSPIDVLQANLLTNSKLDAAINVSKFSGDKKARWRFNAFGTAALDWVTTSFIYKREQNFQKQGVVNYGVNALVAYKRGKVELETGFMFNQKKYSIANVELTTGSVVSRNATKIEKPQDLRLSIVSIPLNVNVYVKQTRRLNLYAHAGVATNAIVDALDRREIIKPVDPDPNGSPAPPPSEVEKAEYSKGLRNGGETRDNVFLTTHIGLGLEYKLTPKTSIFLQPTASFLLNKDKGIGTLNDRISTYSIQGGAKWRL